MAYKNGLHQDVHNLLNRQINRELFSEYVYLALATYFELVGFTGFSKWAHASAAEERKHALKIVDYLVGRNYAVIYKPIEVPDISCCKTAQDVRAAFQCALDHEQSVSDDWRAIVLMCLDKKDTTTHEFAQWYVAEQVEEERKVFDVLQRLDIAGDDNILLVEELTVDALAG